MFESYGRARVDVRRLQPKGREENAPDHPTSGLSAEGAQWIQPTLLVLLRIYRVESLPARQSSCLSLWISILPGGQPGRNEPMGCFCVGMVDQVKKKAQGRHPQEQDAEQQPEQKAFLGVHPIRYLLKK